MTEKQFLKALAKHKGEFYLAGKRVRGIKTACCPMEHVAGTCNLNYAYAARTLKIKTELSEQIVCAADAVDYLFGRYSRPLRKKILKAAGLKEAK